MNVFKTLLSSTVNTAILTGAVVALTVVACQPSQARTMVVQNGRTTTEVWVYDIGAHITAQDFAQFDKCMEPVKTDNFDTFRVEFNRCLPDSLSI